MYRILLHFFLHGGKSEPIRTREIAHLFCLFVSFFFSFFLNLLFFFCSKNMYRQNGNSKNLLVERPRCKFRDILLSWSLLSEYRDVTYWEYCCIMQLAWYKEWMSFIGPSHSRWALDKPCFKLKAVQTYSTDKTVKEKSQKDCQTTSNDSC